MKVLVNVDFKSPKCRPHVLVDLGLFLPKIGVKVDFKILLCRPNLPADL